MQLTLRGASLILSVVAMSTYAIDGFTATTEKRWRDAGVGKNKLEQYYPELSITPFAKQNTRQPGKIVKSIIRDNAVVDSNLIVYDKTLARYPVISPDGSRIAFFRYDAAIEGTSLTGNLQTAYLSVINVDGTGLKDLITMQMPSDFRFYFAADWPAGEFIYYQKIGSMDIWKIKADGSGNQKVHGYREFRNWELSLNAERAAIHDKSNGDSNWGHAFPPSGGKGSDCVTIGCNATLSSSGRYMGHYTGSTHSWLVIERWDPGKDCYWSIQVRVQEHMEPWSGQDLDGNFEDRVGGMDWPRWAANSDKWFCNQIGPNRGVVPHGSNQVIVNWVDETAIKITNNKLYDPSRETYTDAEMRFPESGDFYITGHPAGSYEDTAGVWRDARTDEPLEIQSLTRKGSSGNASGLQSISFKTDGAFIQLPSCPHSAGSVELLSSNGRTVQKKEWNGPTKVSISSIPRGTYILALQSGTARRFHRIIAK